MKGFRQWKWHLDEVYLKINGEMHCLWRAVDLACEVLEIYVTKTGDKQAALTFMKAARSAHRLSGVTSWPEPIAGEGELSQSETSRLD